MSYKDREGVSVLSVIKGGIISVLFALAVVAVFAFFVKIFTIPQNAVKCVNQFIKIISVFIGCLFSVRGKAGYIKGALIGAVFTFLLYSVFSIISESQLFDSSFWLDILLGIIVGAIFGIIAVNVKGKE